MASERTQRQIDRLLEEAEEAFSRDEWEPLHERANRRLLLDQENSDARNSVAAAERALGGNVQSQPAHAAPPAPPGLEPSVATPTSLAGGRYRVKDLLGEVDKSAHIWPTTTSWTDDRVET